MNKYNSRIDSDFFLKCRGRNFKKYFDGLQPLKRYELTFLQSWDKVTFQKNAVFSPWVKEMENVVNPATYRGALM
jgi:hypothetical protein